MQQTSEEKLLTQIELGYDEIDSSFNSAILQLSTHPEEKRLLEGIHQNDVKKRLRKSIDVAKQTIRAPYYVLFYGRYSHGKTSLVNKLFEINDSPLKTGTSQMTSRMIRVEFTESAARSAFRQMPGDSKYEPVDIDGLGDASSGADEIATGFIFELPVGDSAIARKFFENRVNLIDAPGMGGKFEPHQSRILPYFREADLIILAISAVEIQKAAPHINDLMSNSAASGKPKIVGLTFWDMIDSDPLYSTVPEDERALFAKELVKTHMPSLARDINLIPVCSETGENIDNLRNAILDSLLPSPPILGKTILTPVMTGPQVKRIQEILAVLTGIESQADLVLSNLENKMSISFNGRRPTISTNLIDQLSQELKILHKGFEHKLSSIFKSGQNDFASRINQIDYMGNEKDLSNFQTQFERDVTAKILPRLREQIQRDFDTDVISPIIHSTNRNLIDINTVDTEMNTDLPKRLKGFIPDFSGITYELPEMIVEKTKQAGKNVFSTILEAIMDPSFLGFALIVFISSVGLQLLSKVGLIERFIPIDFGQIRQIVFLVAGVVLVIKLWITYSSVSSRSFAQSREDQKKKILSSFDIVKYENLAIGDLASIVGKIDAEIAGTIRPVVDDRKTIDSTIRNLRKQIKDTVSSMMAEIENRIASM